MKKIQSNMVYPAEPFLYWLRRWGISATQLNEAIIETGSLDACLIRDFLVERGILISIFGLVYFSKERLKRFFKVGRKTSRNSLALEKIFISIPEVPFMTFCSN